MAYPVVPGSVHPKENWFLRRYPLIEQGLALDFSKPISARDMYIVDSIENLGIGKLSYDVGPTPAQRQGLPLSVPT